MTQEAKEAPKMIKNTFAPDFGNEYFDADGLFALVRAGFGYGRLPPEAKAMVDPVLDAYESDPARKGRGPDHLELARQRIAKAGAEEQ